MRCPKFIGRLILSAAIALPVVTVQIFAVTAPALAHVRHVRHHAMSMRHDRARPALYNYAPAFAAYPARQEIYQDTYSMQRQAYRPQRGAYSVQRDSWGGSWTEPGATQTQSAFNPFAPVEGLASAMASAAGIPVSLVDRVIKRESGGNPRAYNAGNYGLMQIRLGTARAMGYSGPASGLLDAQTNMTYAVKYLAGAYRAAGGNESRAVALYARGYHDVAKAQGTSPYGGGEAANGAREAAYGEREARYESQPYFGAPENYAPYPQFGAGPQQFAERRFAENVPGNVPVYRVRHYRHRPV